MIRKVLIITNKEDVTVDFVIKELKKRNIYFYRLNTESIPDVCQIIINIKLKICKVLDLIKKEEIDLTEYDSVYYRRPLLNSLKFLTDISEEELIYLKGELAFVLEGIYRILSSKYWLNNVYDIRVAENKLYQLERAKLFDFIIPDTVLSNNSEYIKNFIKKNKNDCIIKPVKSAYLKGKGKTSEAIFTSKISTAQIRSKTSIDCFPMYLQNNIPKQLDIRCTVVGDRVFAAQIHSQSSKCAKIDWRRSDTILEHQKHRLPSEITNKCIKLTHSLNLSYSAIDLILDTSGNYIFLELNPNGQWAWIEKRLGYNIAKAIVDDLMKGENTLCA